jgi:hypothetical protein
MTESRPKKSGCKGFFKIVVIILIIGLVLGAIGTINTTLHQKGILPTYTPTPVPTETPVPTPTPVPTNPTETPIPPTVTPIPLAPPFSEIKQKHETMTEAQWKNYRNQIEGTMIIGWQGWIEEVTGKEGRYIAMIDMDSPEADILGYPEINFIVSDDVALSLQIDQPVTFSGQIKSAVDVLGALNITLEHATLQ